jgi:hypothetical protein
MINCEILKTFKVGSKEEEARRLEERLKLIHDSMRIMGPNDFHTNPHRYGAY